MQIKKYDLEDRLVSFSCLCLSICDLLPNSKGAQNLESQLCRSGTGPALIYGEAQAAESTADFIHKMKLVFKEIRETRTNLRIISEKPLMKNELLITVQNECNELMAIFLKSIETAKAKQRK